LVASTLAARLRCTNASASTPGNEGAGWDGKAETGQRRAGLARRRRAKIRGEHGPDGKPGKADAEAGPDEARSRAEVTMSRGGRPE